MERVSSRVRTYKRLLDSYLILRRVLGILGIALPVVLFIWGHFLFGRILPSISDYYSWGWDVPVYYGTRDYFVGTLISIGIFLGAYRGYERSDDIAGYLACIFALGVAFFPNKPVGATSKVHFISATCLFIVLAYFSAVLFTKTKPSEDVGWWDRIRDVFRKNPRKRHRPGKRIRNLIYVWCGIIIILCLLFFAFVKLYAHLAIPVDERTGIFGDNTAFLFWVESAMLWAFGFSWFVKGEWLFFKDRKEPEIKLRVMKLNVRDAGRNREFYHGLLGVPVIAEDENLTAFESGWPNLDIVASARPGEEPAVTCLVKDLDEYRRIIAEKGLPTDEPVPVEYGMESIILTDPDGNRIEIQSPSKDSPEWLREMVE